MIVDTSALLAYFNARAPDHEAVSGVIDDESMMTVLMRWTYSKGYVPNVDGVSTDVYVTGDWDDIELAYYCDLLSDNEFQQLADRQLALDDKAVPSI